MSKALLDLGPEDATIYSVTFKGNFSEMDGAASCTTVYSPTLLDYNDEGLCVLGTYIGTIQAYIIPWSSLLSIQLKPARKDATDE